MDLTINDIIAGYNAQVAELTQKLVLAEARGKALERRLTEPDQQEEPEA